ncbi:MAG: helix-turn-helix domain-containing protein [Nannocystaceae bacterium]
MDATVETLTAQAAEPAEVETTNGFDEVVAGLSAALGGLVTLLRVDGPGQGEEPWMDVPEAAAYARVKEPRVRLWVRERWVVSGRDGTAIKIKASAIDAYLLGGQDDACVHGRQRRRGGAGEVHPRVLQILNEDEDE